MEEYLKKFYDEEITNLLNDANDAVHVSINVSLINLQRHQPQLFAALLVDPHAQLVLWNRSLLQAQKLLLEGNVFLDPDYQIKENCHVRFVQLPSTDPKAHRVFPTNVHIGRFVQVKGNVVRMTQAKLLECKRAYVCRKCKQERLIEAEYAKMFVFEAPRNCTGGCRGIPYQKSAQPAPEHCIDFQEIRIQELISDKNMPASLIVTLDSDLVDSCQPGDCISVCGTVEHRWHPLIPGKRAEVILSLRAISVYREEKRPVSGRDLPEHLLCVRAEWQDIVERLGEQRVRDLMLQSFCPEVHGMYLVKLAIMLALSSGVNPIHANDKGRSDTRGNSHLILVGDPGLAKSRLLSFAAAIAVRSIHTTGMGCSAAGLTAAAVKEDGEWQLEAGALVLADGGVCCIDEFNLMRESDKASIHEAMEQQTISMAKAGLVCKLSTRCIILAATNPKNLYTMSESEGMAAINIGIASPLLSRFDIVLILRDERDPDWDNRVVDHVLHHTALGSGPSQAAMDRFSVTKLQTHFMAIRDIHPTLSKEANLILGAYYKKCRADVTRDAARTSVRLLDSLVRLAQAHTRLMFRTEVTERDATLIVRLMESSWGFGNLLAPQNILKADLPIGPSRENVEELKRLLLLDYTSKDDESMKPTNVCELKSAVSDMFDDLPGDSDFSQPSLLTNQSFKSMMDEGGSSSSSVQTTQRDATQSSNIQSNLSALAGVLNESVPVVGTVTDLKRTTSILATQTSVEDIDAFLKFDDDIQLPENNHTTSVSQRATPTTSATNVLSQSRSAELESWVDFEDDDDPDDAVADDLPADIEMEFSQDFVASTSSSNTRIETNPSPVVNHEKPPQRVSKKTIDRLNMFLNPNNIENEPAKQNVQPKLPSQSHTDSAYDSMLATSPHPTPAVHRGRTSFLSQRHKEEDLDFLDDLDV